ncbi:MAG TPA: flagellar motor stator protein MotA [Bacillota bacterium]|nr:flagellar motor stator protein MotA [Bacillota bacterium]
MDRTTVFGITLGVLVVGVGLYMKGVNLGALLNPAAILIIFAGTAAAVLIAFPASTIKTIPKLMTVIFKEVDRKNKAEIIQQFTHWAHLTRREGILILEQEIEKTEDPFLKSGLRLVVDGQPPDFIRDVMLEKVGAMEERHHTGAEIFTQAGTYAPTLGVLGAVVGLIAALGNMEDMAILGAAISAAFMATLFGIFSGYVLWHPFASKLRKKSSEEVQEKRMIIEGLLSLTSGESPRTLQEKLSSYLSTEELAHLQEEPESAYEEAS